ncbi:hypothetical protein AG1IA_01640 [Rhizoctonia solani AG-1 IA]|uniref:Uncharacterized protein n=1 Tax=Thanatephorus cucumeris (strain AG1-IA) TaxID=983506 RepID=L8X298_THACA|nr:hypothetical protein AG1IA_01640 [Rhizoctonia solani AG-1 IA]
MGEFAYDYVGLDAEHGFPSERGALPPISGAAANHELGSGVGGREGPHQRISADKGRGSVGSSNEKIRVSSFGVLGIVSPHPCRSLQVIIDSNVTPFVRLFIVTAGIIRIMLLLNVELP